MLEKKIVLTKQAYLLIYLCMNLLLFWHKSCKIVQNCTYFQQIRLIKAKLIYIAIQNTKMYVKG